jgi:hypothetical protein
MLNTAMLIKLWLITNSVDLPYRAREESRIFDARLWRRSSVAGLVMAGQTYRACVEGGVGWSRSRGGGVGEGVEAREEAREVCGGGGVRAVVVAER